MSPTLRLWPRWTTSAPCACKSRRIMLMAASWPANNEAALTNREGRGAAGTDEAFRALEFAMECALMPPSCVAQEMRDAYDYELRMPRDRKSTRLNSSHVKISYAVFCLKKKRSI